jgi:hypothetical protein
MVQSSETNLADKEGVEPSADETEEENFGLNTKPIIQIVLFALLLGILLYIIFGIFGILSQAEYGGH